jgi:hypothetical protein
MAYLIRRRMAHITIGLAEVGYEGDAFENDDE